MKKLETEIKELNFKNVEEILEYAITSEQNAFTFYSHWADKVKKDHLKKVFAELAQEEMGHEKFLKKVKEEKIVEIKNENIQDLKISDYLVSTRASEDMDYQDALILAMHREKTAYKLYSNLAQMTEDNNAKSTFMMLAQQEAKHKLRLELIYDDEILIEN